MKKRISANYFRYSLSFSFIFIFLFILVSCSPKQKVSNNPTQGSVSLKQLKIEYGAYSFNIKNKFLKGNLHLNYINDDNYWEFGVIGEDSVNIVKFNGAIYKKIGNRWSLYANYNNFDLPRYLLMILPDTNIEYKNSIKFKPNPIIIRSKDAIGEVSLIDTHFNSLKIMGANDNLAFILLRMLPVLPPRFQTKIVVLGLSQNDSKILYRRLKAFHPMLYHKSDSVFIRLQGYISRDIFGIISGAGEINIYPLKYGKTAGYKRLNLSNNNTLYYKKIARNFKILHISTLNNNITLEFSRILDSGVYGLFIDNRLVAIGRAKGNKIEFEEYINGVSRFIRPIFYNGIIKSKISILQFSDPYNRR